MIQYVFCCQLTIFFTCDVTITNTHVQLSLILTAVHNELQPYTTEVPYRKKTPQKNQFLNKDIATLLCKTVSIWQ